MMSASPNASAPASPGKDGDGGPEVAYVVRSKCPILLNGLATVHAKMEAARKSQHFSTESSVQALIDRSSLHSVRGLLRQAHAHQEYESARKHHTEKEEMLPVERLKDSIFSVEHFDLALADTSKNSPRIVVLVSYKIDHVLRIDQIALTFMAKFTIFLEWNDPRLVNFSPPKQPDWNDPEKRYFDPEIVCVNGANLKEFERKTVLMNRTTGLVKQTICMQGDLVIKETSFKSYPWDYIDLRVCLSSRKYPVTAIILVSHGHSIIQHHPREEWALMGTRTEVYSSNPLTSSCGNSFSEMHIVVMMERDPSWSWRNVIATMSMLWASSMVIMFMPFSTYDALGYRMETAIALVLACVATKFTVSQRLPHVRTVTLAESHMNTTFMGILFNIFTSLVLYIVEKYSDSDSLDTSRSDEERMRFRRNNFGGQSCSYGSLVAAWILMATTFALFVVWHLIMWYWIRKAQRKRMRWRTLALPESVEMVCKIPPSILTQFNGEDTAAARKNTALGKWTHRLHLDKMVTARRTMTKETVEILEENF